VGTGYDTVNARTSRLVVSDDGREELATAEERPLVV
jgi:hypothetical protein